MRLELAEILDPVGLRLEWRSAGENPVGKAFNYLVSVHFQGDCLTSEPASEPMATEELGLTLINDGEVIPYCQVRCDAVRRIAGPLLFREGAARAPVLLGRALARVLAHEIYHVLAETRSHGQRGIAKRRLTPNELVLGPLRLDEAEISALRNRTRVIPPPDQIRSPALKSFVGQ